MTDREMAEQCFAQVRRLNRMKSILPAGPARKRLEAQEADMQRAGTHYWMRSAGRCPTTGRRLVTV